MLKFILSGIALTVMSIILGSVYFRNTKQMDIPLEYSCTIEDVYGISVVVYPTRI